MDRFSYDYVDGAIQHPSVEDVELYGPGFHGYNETKNPLENIVAKYGECPSFDIFFVLHFVRGLDKVMNSTFAFTDATGKKCANQPVKFFEYGDCHPGDACSNNPAFYPPTFTDVVHGRYSGSLMALFMPTPPSHLRDRARLYAHNPDCVNLENYPQSTISSMSSRKWDVQLFGQAGQGLNPIRHLVASAINAGAFSDIRAKVFKHPGKLLCC